MGVGGQRHTPSALPPGKTRYTLIFICKKQNSKWVELQLVLLGQVLLLFCLVLIVGLYANRKYHCGSMCVGVTGGFVGVKLSGSVRMFGSFRVNIVNVRRVTANSRMSFTVQLGWNGILSVFCLFLVDCWILFYAEMEGEL